MSAANWISGATQGKRQARIDRKLRRRVGKAECFGPPAAPDANGCYGWPRACSHHDDLDCMEAEDAVTGGSTPNPPEATATNAPSGQSS